MSEPWAHLRFFKVTPYKFALLLLLSESYSIMWKWVILLSEPVLIQDVYVWMLIRHSSRGWEWGNNWHKFSVTLLNLKSATLSVTAEVTCLGVIFDSELTFAKHVSCIVWCCFYHLRQLRTVKKSFTTKAAKIVYAFTASWIDYCNGVFYWISAASVQALLSVLNASAQSCHAEAKIQPHYSDTTRQLTLATSSSANSIQDL